MTEKQKRRWAIAFAVLIAAAAYAGYAISELNSFRPREVSTAAKLGFSICWSAGLACAISSVLLVIVVNASMRRPGVRWWAVPSTLFDLSFVFPLSDFYTQAGIRTLRKGRYCFTTWLVFWAIGVAIVAAAGDVRNLEWLVICATGVACVAILAAAHGFHRGPP